MVLETKFGKFTLLNDDKVTRVVEDTTDSSGKIVSGLGSDAEPEMILAMYDKLGGAILGENGSKIKTGSFYDLKKKTPKTTPDIVYSFRVNGELIEMKDGAEVPLEVQAVQLAEKVKAKKKK